MREIISYIREGNYTLDLFPIKSFGFFPILPILLLNANGHLISTKSPIISYWSDLVRVASDHIIICTTEF